MAQMIRKQIYIEPRHDRMLKLQALRRGRSEAEIVREALDCIPHAGPAARDRDIYDEEAANQAVAFMKSLASRRTKGVRGRGWTRDQLHIERIGRWAES